MDEVTTLIFQPNTFYIPILPLISPYTFSSLSFHLTTPKTLDIFGQATHIHEIHFIKTHLHLHFTHFFTSISFFIFFLSIFSLLSTTHTSNPKTLASFPPNFFIIHGFLHSNHLHPLHFHAWLGLFLPSPRKAYSNEDVI